MALKYSLGGCRVGMILLILLSIVAVSNSAASDDITTVSDFDSLIFTPDSKTTQWLYSRPHTPPNVPLEDNGYVRVKYQKGDTWADLEKYYSNIDLSGEYLHIDVWAEGSTTGQDPLSPTIKLRSGSTTVLEQNKAIRVGEWTGLNFDLSSLNQQLLSSIDYIDIYLADSINPGTITFRLDDFYVSEQPLPEMEQTQFIIAGILTQLEIDGEIPEQDYSELDSPYIDVYMRTMEYDRYADPITEWDQSGTKYYYTAASSDFENYQNEDLYVPYSHVYEVLGRSACTGVYLHEVVTYEASQPQCNWNWDQAVDAFNWSWLNSVVSRAKSKGKRVIWSEPAGAWEALMKDSYARSCLQSYGDTIVPMFATNFHCEGSGYHLAQSRDHAGVAAGMIGTALGESHQAWYFIDQEQSVSQSGSLWLGKLGRDHRASIFQFEGDLMDMYWDEDDGYPYISEYMKGVRDFADWIDSGN